MKNNTLPYVSVIIPVFNNLEKLRLCLQKLDCQTYPKDLYEIIVVDNNSVENINYLITQFTQVRMTNEVQQGSYAARNKGIAIARGEIIAFTDSDCVPAQDWIAKGVEIFCSLPNCGLVGGKIEIFFKNPKRANAVELFDSMNCLDQKHYVENKNYAATANLFTHKDILKRVGLFNSNLKSGGDREWGQRVFKAGYKIIYADNVCVNHPARTNIKELTKKFIRLAEGKYILQDSDNKTLLVFLIELYWNFKPPFRELWKIMIDDKNIPSIKQRFSYIYIFLLLRFVQAIRKAKLYFLKRTSEKYN